jgi:hypothetical protein
MRHFSVDAHIVSKREVKRIARASGKSRAEVVGLMVCLWGYVAVHSRDTGTIEGDYEDLADELGADASFWGIVESEGWLACDAAGPTITVPNWQERFYTGSSSARSKKYREAQAERSPSARERSPSDSERSEVCRERIDRIDIEIENKKEDKKTDREKEDIAPQGVSSLSDLVDEFWGNLSAAGMRLPSQKPYWLRQELSNGSGAVLLAASRQIANTGLLEGTTPAHLGNFKNDAWVSRLAAGAFNRPGSPSPAAPPGRPPDPEDEWIMFHPAGKRMRRREIKEWLKNPDNLEVFREYQEKYGRKPEVKPPPPVDDSKPIPAIDLSMPPDVSTEEAKKIALNQIAQWQQNEENKDGTIAR